MVGPTQPVDVLVGQGRLGGGQPDPVEPRPFGHVKRAMRQLIKAGTKQIPDTELQRVAVATALVWGRHDRMAPLRHAETASTRLGWPLHIIDDAGHLPHVGQPSAFVEALVGSTY